MPSLTETGGVELLSSAEFGELLGMTAAFVRGEMKDERVKADLVIERPGKQKIYRFTAQTFVAYCHRYCPTALELPHVRRRLSLPKAS